MQFDRSSGILLHPTSLPGDYGIGDLGPYAFKWVDFLSDAGCSLWQILPLGPTGYGDSPYQCFSAFAGNPYLISIELLFEGGLLTRSELTDKPDFPRDRVDFGTLIPWKMDKLDTAFRCFVSSESKDVDFEAFKVKNGSWINDYALFMALKEVHGGKPWVNWSSPLRKRNPSVLKEYRNELDGEMQKQIFRQFIFFKQWGQLRSYAGERKVKIIGDVPIYVAHDSTDIWAHPELFYLDDKGMCSVVAGVPPDYFSDTGQLWGNPIFRWDIHESQKYFWWIERLKSILELVDIVRLDHFRGFANYWEIPGSEKTAVRGQWVDGPGDKFFYTVLDEFNGLPFIAEDLGGEGDPKVITLRKQFDLPNMKLLQFAFNGDPKNPFLPHLIPENCVVYTGTHDNDTTRGYFETASSAEVEFVRNYLDLEGDDFVWGLINAAWESQARMALAPMQDFLNLGKEARMNYPGKPQGNWTWRMREPDLSASLSSKISALNQTHNRAVASR
jgi:4-alpha-glucanotransferase